MSNHRINPKAGPGRARDAQGRPICRQCGGELPKGRRSFCSDACVHEWRVRSNPGYVRSQLFKRDKGVCAGCGLDTESARKAANALWGPERHAAYETHGMPRGRMNSWWDADHIIPVVEGGGLCGLDNFRTLCIPCHRKVTAELRARLAAARREAAEREESLPLFSQEAS